MPETYAALEANLGRHGCLGVTPLRAALGARRRARSRSPISKTCRAIRRATRTSRPTWSGCRERRPNVNTASAFSRRPPKCGCRSNPAEGRRRRRGGGRARRNRGNRLAPDPAGRAGDAARRAAPPRAAGRARLHRHHRAPRGCARRAGHRDRAGVVPVLVPVAKALHRAGHAVAVAVATAPAMADELARHGIEHVVLPHVRTPEQLLADPAVLSSPGVPGAEDEEAAGTARAREEPGRWPGSSRVTSSRRRGGGGRTCWCGSATSSVATWPRSSSGCRARCSTSRRSPRRAAGSGGAVHRPRLVDRTAAVERPDRAVRAAGTAARPRVGFPVPWRVWWCPGGTSRRDADGGAAVVRRPAGQCSPDCRVGSWCGGGSEPRFA